MTPLLAICIAKIMISLPHNDFETFEEAYCYCETGVYDLDPITPDYRPLEYPIDECSQSAIDHARIWEDI